MASYWRGIVLVIGVLVATLSALLCFTQFFTTVPAADLGNATLDIDIFASFPRQDPNVDALCP